MLNWLKSRFNLETILIYTGLTVFALWSLFPILWTIRTSLGPDLAPLGGANPFDFSPRLDNYSLVWSDTHFQDYLENTLKISLTATVLSVVFSLSAAYGFARLKFKGNRFLLQWILSIRLAPGIAFVVPFFMMFKTLDLLDTPIALIMVYTTMLLPFSIWLLTSFIREVPIEAEEAALVDGCNRFQVLTRIVLPQIWPAIGAISLLNLVAAWNEFMFALTLSSTKVVTLPVGMSTFFGERGVLFGQITAAAVLTMIVPVVLSIIIHKYLLRGLTFGVYK